MSASVRSRAPVGLAARGRRFWRATVDRYVLSDVEVQVLAEACRTLDTVEALQEAQAAAEDMAGRLAVLRELRQQRLALGRLLAQLNLPADTGALESPTTVRARKAAATRWDNVSAIRGQVEG